MAVIPVPESERERWEEGERRLGMLGGRWTDALRARMAEFFAREVRHRLGSAVDTSRAPFAYAVDQVNTLHLDPPTTSAGGADLEPLSLETLWPLRYEAQRMVVGLGEALIRWDYVDRPVPRLVQRVVSPTRCVVVTDPRDQHRIVAISEVMEVPLPDGGCMVLRESHDSREGAPYPYRVERWYTDEHHAGGAWVDVTAEQTRDLDGGVPYRDGAGEHLIPYSLHHRRLGSHTWDWCHWSELVDCQLYAGCRSTWILAGTRDNAYPTRYTIDLDTPAGTVHPNGGGNSGPAYILIEPSTIVQLKTSPTAPGGTGSVGSLPATMDTEREMRTLAVAVEAALQDAGLGPADEAPAKGVSGYAIHISREALRRSQKQQTPAARIGDQRCLALGARLANRYLGASLPEDPRAYSLTYHGIPLSTAEVQSVVDRVTRLRDAGLMTLEMALREAYPQMSESDAKALAEELEAEKEARTQRAAAIARPAAAPQPEPDGAEDEGAADVEDEPAPE